MEAPESHHQVHSEVPAMRRGVPKMSGQLIMTFPATCSFFFFFSFHFWKQKPSAFSLLSIFFFF